GRTRRQVTTADPRGVSRREIEVLALVGARLSNADIAGRLHLSVRTVENHVSSLLRKYGVADRRALAEVAAQIAAGVAEPGRLAGAPPLPAARCLTLPGRRNESRRPRPRRRRRRRPSRATYPRLDTPPHRRHLQPSPT